MTTYNIVILSIFLLMTLFPTFFPLLAAHIFNILKEAIKTEEKQLPLKRKIAYAIVIYGLFCACVAISFCVRKINSVPSKDNLPSIEQRYDYKSYKV